MENRALISLFFLFSNYTETPREEKSCFSHFFSRREPANTLNDFFHAINWVAANRGRGPSPASRAFFETIRSHFSLFGEFEPEFN